MKYGIRICCAIAVTIFILQPPTATAGGPGFRTELFMSGFENPVFLTAPPDDTTRIVVLEQESGSVFLIKNGVRQATPFLNIDKKVGSEDGEQGLLGLAFHPDYANNRFLYVNYTDNNGDTVIERYKAKKSFDKAGKKSKKRILKIAQPYSNHNGGMIAFGPNDGYLYIGMGDGGDADDPHNNGQTLNTLLGKMLRIDVDNGDPYVNPSSNPFVPISAARSEIWSIGWRNPWRWSFDRLTGDIYVGDVGQDNVEEIDFQPADSEGGENYGWKIAEGFSCRGGSGTCGTDEGFTPPIIDYGHNEGQVVIGGYVYRGTAIPALAGTYFYADYSFGTIWSLKYDGNTVSDLTERTDDLDPVGTPRISGPCSFGEDAAGELYILDRDDGEIYKIVPDVR
ncbi:MAG: PQQ-dependent sugar dehydrogenase [Candidatus Hydrogenedentes bacterium]|nr:PQQ-dependent sugar dehydrogenase [Candidatus Hydrogenedentota bacterium]